MTTGDVNEGSTADQATAAALAGPTTWQLDPSGSAVTFTHKAMWGLATVRGEFADLSGGGEILADGTASGRLEVGAASVNTKNSKRDQHLRSADFFHAAAHPAIVAEIARATTDDGVAVHASGTLTVSGRSRPLTLTAKITEATAEAITLTADTAIDRGDFGSTWNQLGMLSGAAQMHVVARFVKQTTV